MCRRATLRSVLRKVALLGEQPGRLKPVIAPAAPCSTRSWSAQPWAPFLAGSPLCCAALAVVGLAVLLGPCQGHMSSDPASLA